MIEPYFISGRPGFQMLIARLHHTVRLKCDDAHSDQKFSESELYHLIAWKRTRNAH